MYLKPVGIAKENTVFVFGIAFKAILLFLFLIEQDYFFQTSIITFSIFVIILNGV